MTDQDIQYQEFLALTEQAREAGKRWLTVLAEQYVKTGFFQVELQRATRVARETFRTQDHDYYITDEILNWIGDRWLCTELKEVDPEHLLQILGTSNAGLTADLGRILILAWDARK